MGGDNQKNTHRPKKCLQSKHFCANIAKTSILIFLFSNPRNTRHAMRVKYCAYCLHLGLSPIISFLIVRREIQGRVRFESPSSLTLNRNPYKTDGRGEGVKQIPIMFDVINLGVFEKLSKLLFAVIIVTFLY